MTRLAVAFALLALVAAAPPGADPPSLAPPLPPPPGAGTPTAPPPPKGKPAQPHVLPRGAVLEEVTGVVRSVEPKVNQVTIDTGTGPVTLGYDRNTMVYTASGLGTVRDLKPGVQARAGRNADMLAYWVQVRPAAPAPPAAAPASAPGQGAAPAGGSAAPTEGTGAIPSSPAGEKVGPATVGPSTAPPAGSEPGASDGTTRHAGDGAAGTSSGAGATSSGATGTSSGAGATSSGAAGTSSGAGGSSSGTAGPGGATGAGP
jgi:hypothetical protein